LRGGFRSTVQSATGSGKQQPTTPLRRTVGNLITIALLVVAAALLLRRFGVLH
jgi:flagellar biogenesis protein FliO